MHFMLFKSHMLWFSSNLLYFSGLDEKILYECIKFMETCLEKPVARKAFKAVYTENAGKEIVLRFVVP